MSNSGDLNATYHDYYDGQRLVETRSGGTSGGGLVIRHQVWGLQYIDELVQVTVNRALLDDPDMDASDPDHDVQVVYAVLDPMFSLLGLVDASGDLIERYELDPYGRRQVFGPADVNDTTLTLALNSPARVEADTVEQPYALTDVSHQGLPLDENTSLLYNRARYRNPATGRFISRDPLGYPDGMNGYAAWHVMLGSYDSFGLEVDISVVQDENFYRNTGTTAGTRLRSGRFTMYIVPCCPQNSGCIGGKVVDWDLDIVIYIQEVEALLTQMGVKIYDKAARSGAEKLLSKSLRFERVTWAERYGFVMQILASDAENESAQIGSCDAPHPCAEVKVRLEAVLANHRQKFAASVQKMHESDVAKNNKEVPGRMLIKPHFGEVAASRIVWGIRVDD